MHNADDHYNCNDDDGDCDGDGDGVGGGGAYDDNSYHQDMQAQGDDGDDDVSGADDEDNAHHQDRQAQGAALIDNGLLLQSCFPAFQFSGWLTQSCFYFTLIVHSHDDDIEPLRQEYSLVGSGSLVQCYKSEQF